MSTITKQYSLNQQAFNKQASYWHTSEFTDGIDEMLDMVKPTKDMKVLDVGAGTGLVSRALAPFVKQIVSYDLTQAMLDYNLQAAKKQGFANLVIKQGCAEELPFADNSFDLVISRWMLHHVLDPQQVITEMMRVSRKSLCVIDIVSPENPTIAAYYNRIETLRDNSHTKALAPSELLPLLKKPPFIIKNSVYNIMSSSLMSWLEHSSPTKNNKETVIDIFKQELCGNRQTGFFPTEHKSSIKLHQTNMIILAEAKHL